MASFTVIHTQDEQLDRIQSNVLQAVQELSAPNTLSFVTVNQKPYIATGKEDVIFMSNSTDATLSLPNSMSPKVLSIKSIGSAAVTVSCGSSKVLIDNKQSITISAGNSLNLVFSKSAYWSI